MRSSWGQGRDPEPYLYLAPMLALLAVFTYWPLVHTAYLSVVRWNMAPGAAMPFVGLANFASVTSGSLFAAASYNTVIYLAASIPLKVLLPIPIAVFVWSRDATHVIGAVAAAQFWYMNMIPATSTSLSPVR